MGGIVRSRLKTGRGYHSDTNVMRAVSMLFN
jgi:hypothetical protein